MTFDKSRLIHVVDGPGLTRLCAELQGQPVCIDIETTQLSPFGSEARAVCAALTWQKSYASETLVTYVVGLSHPDSGLSRQWRAALQKVAQALTNCKLIAHNASFDLTWIKVHTGVNLYDQLMCDTALTSHILDESFSAGLKPRAVRDLGAKPWLDFSWKALEADERANPDGRKLAEREEYYRMTEYCAEDTYWTYRLYQLHEKQLDLWGCDMGLQEAAQDDPDLRANLRLGQYYNLVGTRTVCALAAIEENGFALDSEWCRQRLEDNQQCIVASDSAVRIRTQDALEQIEMGAVRMTEELETALAYVQEAECSWSAGSKWFLCWAQLMCAVGELRVASRTPKGRPQWSKEVLDKQAREGSDVALKLREMRVRMTESAYIQSWLNEAQADGRIRASYNYATSPRETDDAPVTGRLSCVTSDTLIEMPRDLMKHPDGIRITDVQPGDWVYAFDWRRELVLRRVKWVGQTGVRQTVVITVRNSEGHEKTLRVTPDHLIRLYNGDWRAAGNLMHRWGDAYRLDGPRVMTMVRRIVDDGYIKFFPNSIARGNGTSGGGKNREHRWVLGQVEGRNISSKVDVHHIDGNRANNHPDNLEALPMHEHRGARHLHENWGSRTRPKGPLFYRGKHDYVVVSVEPGEVEPVWDMEVEDVHNFIANGICVHNCSKPNLQQVARSAKRAFCAAPGHVLVSADYSQVEVRVGAFQARCEPLIEAYRKGLDVHTLMASSTSGIPYDQITSELRQGGKAGVFGFEFGMSAEGFVAYAERTYGVEYEIAEAERVRKVFFETWDGMSQWHQRQRTLARQQGYVVSPLGRIRHLPDAFSQDQYLQGRALRQAINSPVQGMASDIMMLAIWRIDQTDWIKPVAVVHDCVIAEVPEDRADEAAEIVREAMEQGVLEDMAQLGCRFDVPLVADISISKNWGE